eukprot:9274113-Pyramimonas_sp.AAC.1
MRRAGKRRAVPPETAPLELWDMILSPEHGIPEENAGAGLGYEEEVPDLQPLNHLLHLGLSQIRRAQMTPLYWHRSREVGLPKSSDPGPRGRRLIHTLPSFGKAWFAERLIQKLPYQDHGFARHRRREDAIASTMIIGYRLRQAGWAYATTMKDLSNAFGSTRWDRLDKVVQEVVPHHDRVLCRQRYRLSVVEVETSSGILTVKTG